MFLTCLIPSTLLNVGLTFPAGSDRILMKDGLSGQYLERGGNAKKLFDAQVPVLDRKMYITWGKYCLLEKGQLFFQFDTFDNFLQYFLPFTLVIFILHLCCFFFHLHKHL